MDIKEVKIRPSVDNIWSRIKNFFGGGARGVRKIQSVLYYILSLVSVSVTGSRYYPTNETEHIQELALEFAQTEEAQYGQYIYDISSGHVTNMESFDEGESSESIPFFQALLPYLTERSRIDDTYYISSTIEELSGPQSDRWHEDVRDRFSAMLIENYLRSKYSDRQTGEIVQYDHTLHDFDFAIDADVVTIALSEEAELYPTDVRPKGKLVHLKKNVFKSVGLTQFDNRLDEHRRPTGTFQNRKILRIGVIYPRRTFMGGKDKLVKLARSVGFHSSDTAKIHKYMSGLINKRNIRMGAHRR